VVIAAIAVRCIVAGARVAQLSHRSVAAQIVLSLAGLVLTAGGHPVLKVDVDTSSLRVAVETTHWR
jgi:hypothetical protein